MRIIVFSFLVFLSACAVPQHDNSEAAFEAQKAESKAHEASEPTKELGANPEEPVNPPPTF